MGEPAFLKQRERLRKRRREERLAAQGVTDAHPVSAPPRRYARNPNNPTLARKYKWFGLEPRTAAAAAAAATAETTVAAKTAAQ